MATSDVVWSYRPDVTLAFFSFMVSGAERLPGGNTLVTEGATGRLFEVTPEGETVWQYWMPLAESDKDITKRKTLFRLQRLSAGSMDGLLKRWGVTETADLESTPPTETSALTADCADKECRS